MTGVRLVPLPVDHLEAELAAFPVASEAALRSSAVALHPDLKRSTDPLWRAAEHELLGAWPAVGLDEFVDLRDRLWFEHDGAPSIKPEPVPLGHYLRRLAHRALRSHGTIAVPGLQPDRDEPPADDLESRARSAWRWLSFGLPPDLLLAALGGMEGTPHAVELVDPILGRILADKGYGELHLHLGAALGFSLLWVATLRVLAEPDCHSDAFSSPGACLKEGRELAPWLIRAALGRYLLAAFLRSADSSFRNFLRREADRLVSFLGASGAAALALALRELERGRLRDDWRSSGRQDHATLRSLYRRFLRPIRRLPDEPDDVWHDDPVAALVPWSTRRGGTPEIGFVSEALEHLEGHPEDRRFARLFWQTIRVRCLYYRHVVQRPMTPGLQWFVRTFDRMKAGRRMVRDRLKTQSAFRLGNHGGGLRSLEVRTSPEFTLSETSDLVRAVAGVQRGEPALRIHSPLLKAALELRPKPPAPRPEELGLVLHFPRERGGGWAKGRPAAFWKGSHADPSYDPKKPGKGNSAGFRYARFYLRARQTARAFARYLLAFPASLTVIRGLDLCTDEIAVPTWVHAPLLRHVRDAGEAASRVLRTCFAREVPPLRTTVHAGEDFIHLLTGLRQIDQSIERFQLRAGDRLGHALALGVDPETGSERAGRIVMPREERLLDLVWEWRWYARNGEAPSSRVETLRREMAIHSERMFGKKVSLRHLEKMDDLLHHETELRLLGFPTGPAPARPDRDASSSVASGLADPWVLAGLYLTSPRVFDHGREIIRVDTAREAESLQALQDGLRRKVGTRGLTIEVNPSSNLLIGHLGELKDHPLWRLRDPSDTSEVARLRICIGSDDPLTFATRLPEEYQHLHDAMILAGYSESEAHTWIEDARQAGLDARFTVAVGDRPLDIEPWLLGSGPAIAPPP
jgi:hypothetical protein